MVGELKIAYEREWAMETSNNSKQVTYVPTWFDDDHIAFVIPSKQYSKSVYRKREKLKSTLWSRLKCFYFPRYFGQLLLISVLLLKLMLICMCVCVFCVWLKLQNNWIIIWLLSPTHRDYVLYNIWHNRSQLITSFMYTWIAAVLQFLYTFIIPPPPALTSHSASVISNGSHALTFGIIFVVSYLQKETLCQASNLICTYL